MKNRTIIIAEAGINHNGSLQKALKLVSIAKSSGADFVKFQLFTTENFINKNFKNIKTDYKLIFKRFKSLEFNIKEWKKIISFGKKLKIKVFFSVFDTESLQIAKLLRQNLIKIPSGEINNIPLLKKINSLRHKVILSTGMSSLKEIKNAVSILKKCEVILLHCVSEYPTLNPNLKIIRLLKNKFHKEIGYSDHTKDIITPALSVVAGAKFIEKHFTYNKYQKIGDHKFSLSPQELKRMIINVRLAENSLGTGIKTISKKELKLQKLARKGLYLNKNKLRGDKINFNDISILRPQGNLSVSKLDFIINKKIKRSLNKDTPLKFSYF